MTVEEFVFKTLELLLEEREAEIQETRLYQENVSLKELQSKGVCLLKLQVKSQSTGLYGRTVVVFEPRKHVPALPSNGFSPGDILGLYDSGGCSAASQLGSGIVTRVSQTSVSVAFDDGLTVDIDSLYNLLKLANDVTYKRMKKALNLLNGYSHGPAGGLINVLFGDSQPSSMRTKCDEIKFLNPNLDESQREAVSFALSQKELAIIHGPPGTGKTTTVVEVILQLVKLGNKVLCCAASNVAVDNLVERLAQCKARVVRLGHPARLLESIQKHSLDAVLAHSSSSSIITDIRHDMDQALLTMKKNKGERSDLKREMGELRKELRTREAAAISEILKTADVVLATNTGACGEGPLKHVAPDHFDVVVIDECAQALEGSCWIPLLRAPKCVLAGDYKQLPPTIKSQSAASKGLALSLMERQVQLYGAAVFRMLTVQYRMNSDIMDWASTQMYESRLRAHASVQDHLLRDLAGVTSGEETDTPLLLIDTAGCGLNETEDPDELSKGNPGEVDIVELHIKALTEAGVKDKDIAVIAPYNLQVDLLRQKLSARHPHLEIKSVDGFQGREKEAVVLSLVRSNRKGEVGFLSENRRLNVAVTRARRHIAVVCDTQTVQTHPFLKSLVDHMTRRGQVRTAFEYLPDIVPQNYTRETRDSKPKTSAKSTSAGEKARERPKRERAEQRKTEAGSESDSKHLTKNQDESKSVDIRKQLEAFKMDATQTLLQFPPSLNSHDRMLVHKFSEELGLQHESRGEGRDRCVSVAKQITESRGEGRDRCVSVAKHITESRGEGRDRCVSVAKHITESRGEGRDRCVSVAKHITESRGEGRDRCVSVAKHITESRGEGRDRCVSVAKHITESRGEGRDRCVSVAKHITEDKSKETREDSKETREDSKETREDSKETREDSKETREDSKETREDSKETREDSKETREDNSKDTREEKSIEKEEQTKAVEEDSIQDPVTQTSIDLKSLHLERMKREQQKREENAKQKKQQQSRIQQTLQPQSKKTKAKKQTKAGVCEIAAASSADTDLDSLLSAVVKAESVCSFIRCKASVLTLGQLCGFCKRQFCLSHHIPEVHGCGDKAKSHARMRISKEGVLFAGSGKKDTSMDPNKKAYLHRKLDSKLKDLATQRKTKSTEKEG